MLKPNSVCSKQQHFFWKTTPVLSCLIAQETSLLRTWRPCGSGSVAERKLLRAFLSSDGARLYSWYSFTQETFPWHFYPGIPCAALPDGQAQRET